MKSRRILIIDDDAELVGVLKTVLESRGYEVEWALDSEEGIRKARRARPDLVLLDMMMRTISEGVTAAQEIKNDPKLSSVPIIMMTAVSQETGFSFSPEADRDYLPIDSLLEKPVDPQTLLREIKAALGD
jgi:CheY-like chemotaxis protein